ncbi:MarR family transcriptional regulator [Flavobacteriaceae bacterium 3-367]|uniref:MarR family winged helix-turn-helix transcriptional regulator n=1 Tax=Eudoraea algarum TaxID=3417568 RepID=UPI00327FC102
MKYRLEQCIGSRLRKLSRIADGYIRGGLTDSGVTENQMTILFTMHELGRVEQGKLGEVLCLERSTVSRNIKILERKGLVGKTDDYRPHVELTAEGNQLVVQLIPKWEKAMDRLMELLGDGGMDPIEKLEKNLT